MPNTRKKADVKSHVRRVLEQVEPDLLPEEISELVDEMESFMAAYALQATKDEFDEQEGSELKRHAQGTLEKSIAIALTGVRNAVARESPKDRAEKRLRQYISHVLSAEKMGLVDTEKRRIEDLMIRLLDDYNKASQEQKSAVYERGEQQVISTLDPPAISQGASARG